MDLILWRHAEAIDVEMVGDDMLRSLTGKGEKQAARMAAWLDRQLPEGAKLADVVKALNSLGATPQDLLAILQAMKAAGALQAELEVI